MNKWNFKSGERVTETVFPRLHPGKSRAGVVIAQVDTQLVLKFDGERGTERVHVNQVAALPESMQIIRELATAKSCY